MDLVEQIELLQVHGKRHLPKKSDGLSKTPRIFAKFKNIYPNFV
jgi:hypothetical protein